MEKNGILAFSNRPSENADRVGNYAKYPHEIKTDVNDLTDGLKVDDIARLEPNNLYKNIFELKGYKTVTQLYVSKNKNKDKCPLSKRGSVSPHDNSQYYNLEINQLVYIEEHNRTTNRTSLRKTLDVVLI